MPLVSVFLVVGWYGDCLTLTLTFTLVLPYLTYLTDTSTYDSFVLFFFFFFFSLLYFVLLNCMLLLCSALAWPPLFALLSEWMRENFSSNLI